MFRASPIKLSLVLPIFAALACAPVVGFAQSFPTPPPAGADVEVRAVRFRQVPAPGGGQPWLEAAVELAVRSRPDAGAYAGWVDRVQVSLSFGIRKRAGDFDFFRSSAELVALDQGRAYMRFYLPPEVVRREQLNSDPVAWLVELAVRGRPVPAGEAAASPVLRDADALRSFKDRVAQAAPLNDGVLAPQYDSPFAASYGGDTPSFVRRPR